MEGIISMSMKETSRISILEKLMKKEIKQKHAAKMLSLSVRQIQRLVRRYKRLGVAGIPHKLRGTISNHKIPDREIKPVLEIIHNKYADFGVTLAHEKLVTHHGVTFSRETLRQAMITAHLWHSKQRKHVELRQMRERRSCEGELVQLDGSPHDWFEGRNPQCTLLVFIDDATGKLKHLKFVISESTAAYFMATKEYLTLHGKPLAFYLDKHGVFRVNTTKGGTAGAEDSNGLTQFGRAMSELTIELIFAGTPQAKGRVERVNQTLQDRLVKEMRLRGINTMQEANSYLPEFIEFFNHKFAVAPKEKANLHRPLMLHEHLDQILSEQHTRMLSKQLTLSYQNRIYQIKTDRPTYAMRYAPVLVRQDMEGKIMIEYKGKRLNYTMLTQQPKAEIVDSKHLNLTVDHIRQERIHYPDKAHTPKPDHPWKRPMWYTPKFHQPAL
ncbi:MAG: ISNCY family transposase [Patescibacteria group bacterium]